MIPDKFVRNDTFPPDKYSLKGGDYFIPGDYQGKSLIFNQTWFDQLIYQAVGFSGGINLP